MKNYYLTNNWDVGDGHFLIGDGNPFLNDFQHNGSIINGKKIFFPFSFTMSENYNTNLIFNI